MRWHYRDAGLLWLLPLAYAAHLAEEVWAGEGFPAWIACVAGRPLPLDIFLAINAVAITAVLLGTAAATRSEAAGWLATAFATIFMVNAMLHLIGSTWTRTYSPGLVTGMVLYVPICLLTLLRAWQQSPRTQFWRGFSAGIVLHAVGAAITLASARSAGMH